MKTKSKYDTDKYNNLTVEQYIRIKLDMIKKAQDNPMNNMFGNMQVLLTIEQMFKGDLAELLRHTVTNKELLK